MARKASEIIGSIHKKTKSVGDSLPKQTAQPTIVSGASKIQTKAFEKIACAVADIAAGTGGVPTSRSITGVNSVQGGGDLTVDRTVQLVGDELNPGTNQYYGTDGTGSKGYHDLPGAGSGTDLGIVGRTDETLNISSSTGADATVPAATEFLAGLMTAQDKTKIDGVETGAEANVQADWNEADIGSDAYIKNKPTIPTDTGVVYSLADETPVVVTIGNRGIASAGTDADKEYETSQTIDPLTGNTINQNFANGTVNFDNAEINNTDSEINNINTTTNNDTDSNINNNGNTITNTATTENNVGATENYDNTSITNNNGNTTNNTDTTTNNLGDEIVNLAEDATITNNFDGDVNNNYSDTYEETNTYIEGAIINNTGDVVNNNTNYTETNNNTNTIVNNNGGIVNNEGTTNNYDENSVNNFESDIYIGGDIIQTTNNVENGTVASEVAPGVSWTNIANVLSCDGTMAVATPIVPTLLDSVRLVINDVISGNTKTNGVTSGNPSIYGNGSDLWGLTITPADVNDVDFGVVFKFGDSAYIKVTGFNFAIPLTNTILGVKVNVTFTSTPTSVSVDCITMTIYHTDNSEFVSGIMVQQAGVDVAQATTLNIASGATATDMGNGVIDIDIPPQGVQSVTGDVVDNTDPLNPVVDIVVDGITITGTGTILDPFVAVGGISNDIYNNYLILTGTMAGTPPEVDIADTRITDTTPYVIFYETQPVGNITRTLINGNLHIESDDNADTLDVKVVFIGIGPARNYMKGVFAFTGTTHQILDPRIVASSCVVAMPRPTPVGYITGSTDVGEINFASTGVEIGVLVDYVVFNDGVAFSDGMAYNPALDDDDILFRKNSASGVDEAFKVSDLKGSVTSAGTRAFVTITKMFNEPSTTTTYTHTLGRVPKYIKMEGICATGGDYTSFGSWITGGTQICVWKGAFGGSFTNQAIAVIAYDSGNDSTIGVISNVTANSFDIIWTHSSSNTPTIGINFLVTLQ